MRQMQQLGKAVSARGKLTGERKCHSIVAMLCVLLITLGACVQACHVHDDGGPTPWKASHRPTPGNAPASPPDHCLLCVVMHAAMPSAQGVALAPMRQIQPTIPVALLPRRVQRVSFDLFSRPPPRPTAQISVAGQMGELRAL